MEGRRICLLNDSFPPIIDGVANAVTNYALEIGRQYGSASVVTPYYPDADDSGFPFPVLRYPSIDLTKLVGYRAGWPLSPEVMQQVERSGFDLIHSHCPVMSTTLARILRDRLQVPLVLTYHTKFDIDIANALRGKLLQDTALRLMLENISACDEVWTVSRGAGENLRALGYEGEYIVMPNGVDLPAGRVPEEEIRGACADMDLPENVPVYLFIGRMMWYKGIRIILDALKKLRCSGYTYRMVFVGGGSDKQEIEAYCRELGLCDWVFFLPPIYERESIRAWYCRADLFLFPSTFDTNGLVVREAAACGLASVVIRGSCAAEDAADGRNAFFMEENADSMADLLEKLSGRWETLRQVGENARKELYVSWEDSVRHACERYEIVLDRFRSGLYPPHEALADDLLRGMAESMAAINRMRNLQQALREDMEENRERRKERREQFRQKLDRFL